MIDIHSHVLPGVDDGSPDMEDSLELLSMAADSGVNILVATPHCNIPDEYENYVSPELQEVFDQLDRERERAGISLRLCRGMEIFGTQEVPELLRDGKVWTLNGSSYFLMEFSFGEDPGFCQWLLHRCAEQGFRPVIAHPERYSFIQEDPMLAYEWCTAGYALQLNKGSILGRFGPEAAWMAEQMLQHGLAACVASDAHSPFQRSTHMGEIREFLLYEYGESYSKLLLEENPARILAGRDLLGFEPIPF